MAAGFAQWGNDLYTGRRSYDIVGHRLGRVPLIGETVPDGHAGVVRQLLDGVLSEAAELDAVIHAAEDPRGVCDRLVSSDV